MNKPNPRLLLGCPADVRRYITELEQQVKAADERTVAAIQHHQSVHRQLKQTALDQFAMHLQAEVYHQVMFEVRHDDLANRYLGMNIYEVVAQRAYSIAEAMQAESQKRQGGEA